MGRPGAAAPALAVVCTLHRLLPLLAVFICLLPRPVIPTPRAYFRTYFYTYFYAHRSPMPHAPSLPAAPAARPWGHAVRTELAALWRLAWPMVVGQLATMGMAVTDIAMAGHASAQDLAGVSLGVSVWNIAILTLMGLVMSVNALVAQHVGANEPEAVGHVVRQGLWKALGLGGVALLLAQAMRLWFGSMALEPEVRRVAQEFVGVMSWSLPAFACYRVLYGYSTSINQTKPMMVIALGALLLNALANWVLVFGHWGFAAQGGVGCAWATTLCVYFNLLALLLWMRYARAYRSTWPLARFEAPHWPQLRRMLHLGLPIGVANFAEVCAFSLVALLIAQLGSREVAAHQIALNFTSLTFMLPMSLGMALLSRVGQSLGAQAPQAARFQAQVGVGAAVAFSALSAAVMGLWSPAIARLYTSDAAVAHAAAGLLVFAALFQLPDCVQVVSMSALRGYKVTRVPMVLHLSAFWGVSLPLGYVLGLAPAWSPWHALGPLGAQGFWIALIAGLGVSASGLVLVLWRVAGQRCALPPATYTPAPVHT